MFKLHQTEICDVCEKELQTVPWTRNSVIERITKDFLILYIEDEPQKFKLEPARLDICEPCQEDLMPHFMVMQNLMRIGRTKGDV